MKTLYLSDLHLGSPMFKSEDKILSLLNNNYDQIFLVGDIIDTWEEPKEDTIRKYPLLIDRLNEMESLFIVQGNHDPSVEELKEIFPNADITDSCAIFYTEGQPTAITHGHEFDNLIVKHYWLAKLLFPIHWVLERLGIDIRNCCNKLYHSVARKIQNKCYHDLVLNIEQDAVEEYKNFRYIVMGHTHLPKLVASDNNIYINCGDWIDNKTYVECIDGEFRLMGRYTTKKEP